MYHISPVTRKIFICIYNFKIKTKKCKLNEHNEVVTGNRQRMLILKKEKNLKGNCSTWSEKTPLYFGFAERILYRIMSTEMNQI